MTNSPRARSLATCIGFDGPFENTCLTAIARQ